MSSITLFVVIIYTAVLLALAASSECKKKAVKKKIKQYQGKCLKRGFQSSIGCKKEKGKLSKKAEKKCRKIEGALKKCDYSCLPPVDGGWTDYREWTETACSAQCGGGRQTRRRSCSNPAPTFGGADCVGKAEESQRCNTKQCPGNCVQITIISFISEIDILILMNKMKSSNSKTVPCDFIFTVIISLYVFLNLILKHWTF